MRKPTRKTVIRGGIVVLALLALVIAPGYAALQPDFLERYPEFESTHGTWATSVHAKVSCQECHVQPTAVAQTAYAARMLGEFYVSLVSPDREPALFPKPTDAACQSCHYDLRTVSPSGDLSIPHRAHVDALDMRCVDCHNYMVHEPSPEGGNTPTMAGCLTCHDGETAKNDCSACHTDKDQPESHTTKTWLVDHATQPQGECTSCHKWTEAWCADCHARRPDSHTVKWRETHGDVVKTARNCEACHDAAFCKECHGEVPKDNFDPLLKVVQ